MPIVTRVTIDGIIAQFNTKLEILPTSWSVKTGKVIGHSSENKQHTAQLEQIKASLYGIYHELQRNDNYVNAEKVKNEFLGISENHETLLSLFR